MASQIFINFAVNDLDRSVGFYTAMGFTINPDFSDESAKCLVWSETIFVMIMTRERFASFTTKPIADTKNNIAGIFALTVDSIDKMNDVVNAGLAAGGRESKALIDHGFMQVRTVEDFDGHTWEVFFMDMGKMPKN